MQVAKLALTATARHDTRLEVQPQFTQCHSALQIQQQLVTSDKAHLAMEKHFQLKSRQRW